MLSTPQASVLLFSAPTGARLCGSWSAAGGPTGCSSGQCCAKISEASSIAVDPEIDFVASFYAPVINRIISALLGLSREFEEVIRTPGASVCLLSQNACLNNLYWSHSTRRRAWEAINSASI